MILSKTCYYAVRAALYVASKKDRPFVPIKEIAENLNISFHFLTKILQILTQKGLMKSYRGPNGGIMLAADTDKISLKDIIIAIDGPDLFEKCLLGLAGCSQESPCPLHKDWEAVRMALDKMFQSAKLTNLADKISLKEVRISDLNI